MKTQQFIGAGTRKGAAMITEQKHLCISCKHDFATCIATRITWGIDLDPSARGADADRVLECNGYEPRLDAEKEQERSSDDN